MITLKKLLERAKTEKIAIHTPTKEQAITLMKALDKKSYRWNSGKKPKNEAYYENYEKRTCYDIEKNNEVCYGSLEWYEENDYTIIEFKDIDFKVET